MTLGKLNCDEFAMGSNNENSAYGVNCTQPWDATRIPGGSSGERCCRGWYTPAACGHWWHRHGGSIRQPAAFCGITGIKPTYGRASRFTVLRPLLPVWIRQAFGAAHKTAPCSSVQALCGPDPGA